MSELENVDLIVASKEESFGGILKLEREKKGLTIEDVCDDLHLDTKIIYALENHNLNELPEPAFVCGYIRNYARFLKLQAEPIVEDFKKEVNLSTELNSVKSVKEIPYNRPDRRSHYLLLFLFLLLVMGGYFGWEFWKSNSSMKQSIATSEFSNMPAEHTGNENDSWLSQFSFADKDSEKETIPEFMTETKFQNLDSSFGTQVSNSSDSIVTAKVAETQLQEDKKNAVVEPEASNTEQNIKAIESVTSLEKTAETGQETAGQEIEPAVDSDNNTTVSTQVLAASDLESQVNSQSKRLIEKQQATRQLKQINFSFSKDSWISVKDANDKSLVYDLMRAGEKLELKGMAPIRVFLGDATGVRLLVDDEAFDMSRFINRKNIAKFNVN